MPAGTSTPLQGMSVRIWECVPFVNGNKRTYSERQSTEWKASAVSRCSCALRTCGSLPYGKQMPHSITQKYLSEGRQDHTVAAASIDPAPHHAQMSPVAELARFTQCMRAEVHTHRQKLTHTHTVSGSMSDMKSEGNLNPKP